MTETPAKDDEQAYPDTDRSTPSAGIQTWFRPLYVPLLVEPLEAASFDTVVGLGRGTDVLGRVVQSAGLATPNPELPQPSLQRRI